MSSPVTTTLSFGEVWAIASGAVIKAKARLRQRTKRYSFVVMVKAPHKERLGLSDYRFVMHLTVGRAIRQGKINGLDLWPKRLANSGKHAPPQTVSQLSRS